MKNIVSTTLVTAILAGCSQATPPTLPPEVTTLQNSLIATEARVRSLEKQVLTQAVELSVLKVDQRSKGVAVLNPGGSDGYTSAQTSLGTLLIATDKIAANGSGTRLTLYVGNPSTARLGGTELSVRYGTKYQSGEFSEWEESLHTKKMTLTQDLFAGAWSRVDLALGDVKPEDLSFVELTFEPQEVFLVQR
jgi:hypothetical protein